LVTPPKKEFDIMEHFGIRLAMQSDAPDIAEVCALSYAAAYKDIMPADYIRTRNASRPASFYVIPEGNDNVYIVLYDGKAVGIMKAALPLDADMGDDAYELHYIYLHPDFFRKGIGTKAMEFAFKKARGLNKSIMTVWVLAENINSINFYKKCGFAADGGKKTKEYGRVLELVRMRKDL
jgi:GNAT superfamily N-acetyltransferase